MSDELRVTRPNGLSMKFVRLAGGIGVGVTSSNEDWTEEDYVECREVITDADFLKQQRFHCKSYSSSRLSSRTTGNLLTTSGDPATPRRSSLDRSRARRPLTLIRDLAHIRLKRFVGSGGFGSVHVGLLNGRTVAVKRMHRCVRNRRAVAESVRAECRALHLRHPNVVRVLAIIAGIADSSVATVAAAGEVMVVMEYAGQRNLQSLINDSAEEIGFQRILRYCIDMASAINYIHRNRIVHLDLKPSNIIVTRQDTCKLADFGCCRSLDDVDADPQSPGRRSELTGTYAYRAPELLRGLDPTSKADIYSFGIVLWQLLTRDVPFARENEHVVIFRVVAQELRPQVPEWIENCGASSGLRRYRDLFVACWGPAPERRPSAVEVHAALCAIRCSCG